MTTPTASTPELAICERQPSAMVEMLPLDALAPLARRAMDDFSLPALSVLSREYVEAFLAQGTWFLPFAGEWAEFNGAAVREALPDALGQQLAQAISAGFLATTDAARMAADALAESVLHVAVNHNPSVLLTPLPGFEQTNAVL